ncbi:MAG: carboxypeptidase regulatory-like domain-containing protein [Acidobacteria bacterium]|nr:carboxypeptidase regulatory-like domain-containing protein [Acidobacteriota bacterium]
MVHLNSGSGPSGTGTVCSLVPPAAPDEALIADNADPGDKAPTYKNQPVPSSALTHDPGSEENRDKKSWIEIELVDEEGNPVPGERYEVTLPDGSTVASGTLDERGFAHIGNTDPGTCKITFPDLDKDAWEPK